MSNLEENPFASSGATCEPNDLETEHSNKSKAAFNDFCYHHGLDDIAKRILVSEGCGSLAALSALQAGDFQKLHLPLGQIRILERALNLGQAMDVSNLTSQVNGLHIATEHNQQQDRPLTSLGLQYNIASDKAALGINMAGESEVEYYDIVRFLDMGIADLKIDKRSAQRGSHTTPSRINESSDSLEGVYPTRWLGANAKIMAKLLAEGKLDGDKAYGYLAHTLRISQLAESHTWRSVLHYDRKFRIRQAGTQMGWGVEPSGLASTCLEPKPRDNKRTTIKSPRPQFGEPCRLYNIGKCQYNPCRYPHKCVNCGGPHPGTEHPKSQDNTNSHAPWNTPTWMPPPNAPPKN